MTEATGQIELDTPDARSQRIEPPPARPRRLLRSVENYLFLLPAAAMVGVFLLWPALRTFALSLTNSDGLSAPDFVGIANYTRFINDPILIQSLTNTFIWLIASLILPVVIGLAMAVGTHHVAGGLFYRLPFILPYALSGTAVGVVWSFMLRSDGVINDVLTVLGFDHLAIAWLLTPPYTTYAMIIASTWQIVGINVILLLVGLQAMPKEPVDAARLDGAHGWTMLRYITLPLIRPMMVVVVAMTLVNSLRTFDIIWVMTQGGPFRSSETLAVTMFREAFLNFRQGYAAAIAVVLTLLVLGLSAGYLRRQLQSV